MPHDQPLREVLGPLLELSDWMLRGLRPGRGKADTPVDSLPLPDDLRRLYDPTCGDVSRNPGGRGPSIDTWHIRYLTESQSWDLFPVLMPRDVESDAPEFRSRRVNVERLRMLIDWYGDRLMYELLASSTFYRRMVRGNLTVKAAE